MSIETEGVVRISYIAGNCPVQAEGHINETPFYFRARGDAWCLSVGESPLEKPDWQHEQFYGQWPDAGWMPHDVAASFIMLASQMFLRGERGARLEDATDYPSRLANSMARISEGATPSKEME